MKNNFSPPIIEDWHSDDESEEEISPIIKGNPQQEYKEKGVIDNGCSRHMTENKCYLTNFKASDGIFVSFEDGKDKGIKKEYSVARTSQQNGVAEKRNKTMIEAARTMLLDSKLPTTFWAEAVNNACYVLNWALVTKPHNKTSYELIRGRPPLIDFMKPFSCLVTILNTKDNLGKFVGKANEGYFVRPDWLFHIDSLTISMNYMPVVVGNQTNGIAGSKENLVAGTKDSVVDAGKKAPDVDESEASDNVRKNDQVPRCEVESLFQQEWMSFYRIVKVWILVDLPKDKWGIGTKWVYKNKKDERGIVIKNKVRSVSQGHTQEEGIDYDEVFVPVVRIEALRLFLAYAFFKHFAIYQMDVKSAFLYGRIEEEVYVCQPPSFEDPNFPAKVYKVEKALYGLHQAPIAWYETLSAYLLDNGFHRGQIDKTLVIKRDKNDILLVQVYVDDIIFGSTKKELSTEFEKLMHDKFQISSMGELSFFLGLQLLIKDEHAEDVDVYLYRSMIGSLMHLTASRPGITFDVCACARFQVNPKTSHLYAVKRIFRYLKGQPKLGLWYPKDSPFDLEAYSDSDYARESLDRKSTTGGCKFLGKRLMIAKDERCFMDTSEVTIGNPLLMNPTIYVSCVKQFWAIAKVQKVNDQEKIQALVDKTKVIIIEDNIRSDLRLDDAEGTAHGARAHGDVAVRVWKRLDEVQVYERGWGRKGYSKGILAKKIVMGLLGRGEFGDFTRMVPEV
nr:retrovirus-related Pol polyprotein from transposon TNT 1-94 [Tanacetum cinerariifolium]